MYCHAFLSFSSLTDTTWYPLGLVVLFYVPLFSGVNICGMPSTTCRLGSNPGHLAPGRVLSSGPLLQHVFKVGKCGRCY